MRNASLGSAMSQVSLRQLRVTICMAAFVIAFGSSLIWSSALGQATRPVSEARQKAEAQLKLTAMRLARGESLDIVRAGFLRAHELDPTYALPLLTAAGIAERQEDWQGAADLYAQYCKLDDKSELYVRVQLRLDQVRKNLELDKTPEGKLRRKYATCIANAKELLNSGNSKEAVRQAEAAVKLDPNRWEAYAMAASTLAKQGRFFEAAASLKWVLERAPAGQKELLKKAIVIYEKEGEASIFAAQAIQLVKTGNNAEAARAYEHAYMLASDHEQWGLSAALAYGAAKYYAQSAKLLDQLSVSKDRNIAKVAQQANGALAQIGHRSDDGVAPPDNPEVQQLLEAAGDDATRGNADQALAIVDHALKIDFRSPYALALKTQLLTEKSQFARLRNLMAPALMPALLDTAKERWKNHDYPGALAQLADAQQLDSDNKDVAELTRQVKKELADVLLGRASDEENHSHGQEAIMALNKLLQLDPKNEQAIVLQKRILESYSRVNSIGMTIRRLPHGSFLMGSPPSEPGRHSDEQQHQVTLSKDFYLAAAPVTVAQFSAFVKASGYRTIAEQDGWSYVWIKDHYERVPGTSWRNPGFDQKPDHPVVQVSWVDAENFCKWLSEKEGVDYRLPTEAEWERACRAGRSAAYFWGAEPEGGEGFANCADSSLKARFPEFKTFSWNDGYVFTSPVASFKPSDSEVYQLYDMVGNVKQWCADWYAPYLAQDVIDPNGPVAGAARILRGGGWNASPNECRSASRSSAGPRMRTNFIGFRVFASPNERQVRVIPAATQQAGSTSPGAPMLAGKDRDASRPDGPAQKQYSKADSIPAKVLAEFHGETLERRLGRDVKVVAPHFPTSAVVDLLASNPSIGITLGVKIDSTGKVQDASITHSSGSADIDHAVLACVYEWRFAPSSDKQGQTVADAVAVSVILH